MTKILNVDILSTSVRIIKEARLKEYWHVHERAKSPLERWRDATLEAEWKSFPDVRKTFGSADNVRVSDEKPAVVFNIGGNNWRLITVIHYNTQIVYVRKFMTHAEYDKGRWKENL